MTDYYITFIFKAEQFSATRTYHHLFSASQLLTAIAEQQKELENTYSCLLKSFLRTDPPPPKPSRYLSINKPRSLIEAYFHDNKPRFIVQFLHQRKDEQVRCEIRTMLQVLARRQKELGQLNDELKDEYNQLKAMGLISRVSQKSSIDDERWIEVSLVVVDPLVDGDLPVFQDEIDLPSHIDRLKKASMSNHNLMIRVKAYWGSREELRSLLTKQGLAAQKISVVQIFTRVTRKKGKLMIAVEKGVGQRDWEDAAELLKDCLADLIIVIGVGANLLREIKISKSLILISTCSSQEKRSLFNKNQQTLSQAEPPYNDRHCQVFLEQLYQCLFQRKELEDSFQEAKAEACKYTSTYIWCCCLHEHAEDCRWPEIISKIGQLQAHRIFRHLRKDWNKNNFFPLTSLVQSYLVGNGQTCVGQGPCCYAKMGLNRKTLHQNQLCNSLLVWNGQSYSGIEPACEQRTNRFESDTYDKPIGRKRPLTIYKFIQQLLANSILILRSPQIALAKRYFSFAKEYLQARRSQVHFIDVEFNSEAEIRKIINDSVKSIQSSSRLGLTNDKIQLYISMLHNPQKSDKFYDKILSQYPTFASDLKQQHSNVQLRFLLLTCDRFYSDHYPSSWIDYPQLSEKYHYILSKTSYQQIGKRWDEIRDQIEKDNCELPKEVVQSKCEALSDDAIAYEFLGFLAQFSDDGFYLTKSGRIVISHLFSQTVIEQAINGHLPVEHISLNDSIYLQLHKPYHDHFKRPSNYMLFTFTVRKLEYYYLLLKLYTDLLPDHIHLFPQAPPPLKRILKGEGLFSVDIDKEISSYNQKLQQCMKDLKQTGEASQILYNYNSFRHGYHLVHIQKILNEAIKRRRRNNPSSRSALKATQPQYVTFLVWNIALKGLILSLTTSGQLKQKADHFQNVLLIFLVKVDVSTYLAEMGRIQLMVALGRAASKLQDVSFKFMTDLLNNLRNYANRQQQLSCLQLEWGNTNKFKELLKACIRFAGQIRQMLLPEKQEFLRSLSAYGMFHRFDCHHWTRQIIKLIQKKVLYYFHFSRMLKSISSASLRRQKEAQFHKEFKLSETVYEFGAISKLLGQKERSEPHRVLIDLYLKVLKDEYEVDTIVLESMRGKLSPEYLPIFNHLCNKIEQKALFNQKGLIICARARPILADGKPCLFTRKRNLTMKYLKNIIEGRALKISYFTLTPNTLSNLQSESPDIAQNKCEMLMLILTVDAPSKQALLFGSDLTIEGQMISLSTFAQQLINCRLKILILCGRNSSHVCEYIHKAYASKSLPCPALISIQSSIYSLSDSQVNKSSSNGWAYLCNQVSQMAADMIILSVVAIIKKSITGQSCILNEQFLKEKTCKGLRLVGQVLKGRFDCAEEVMQQIEYSVIMKGEVELQSLKEGVAEDLTAKFYSYDSNLRDESYYENVGRGDEVNRVLTAVSRQGQRCVQILGASISGKSTLLQQICWICQTKSLFRFGIFKYDLLQEDGNSLLAFLRLRDFKQSHTRTSTGLLLALDNVTQQFIENHSALLSRLKGKAVTIIYSIISPAAGLAFQKLLQIRSCLRVNLNVIKEDEIYGLLMSHIKEREEAVLTREVVAEFEERVREIMKQVAAIAQQKRLSVALKALRKENQEEERTKRFLQFYQQNYQALMKLLHNYRQVTLTIE